MTNTSPLKCIFCGSTGLFFCKDQKIWVTYKNSMRKIKHSKLFVLECGFCNKQQHIYKDDYFRYRGIK